MNVIYLAVPYSHPNPNVRDLRYRLVTHFAARMIQSGLNVYSPISHTHPMADYDLPSDSGFWLEFDYEYLLNCREMWVLMLDGWRESKGVNAEIRFAHEHNIPVRYVEYGSAIHPAAAA